MHDDSNTDGLPGLAVMLKLAGRRCIVVGGGAVAARRTAALVECGAEVVVVAPQMDEKLDRLLIERRDRGYEAGDLDGAFLVVIATDRAEINEQVAADAEAAGVLVNRTDAAEAGDLTVMAAARRGPLTVAVDTGQTSAAASKAIRQELFDRLDPDWAVLLGAAGRWRKKIRRRVTDPAERTRRLRGLTDQAAMRILKDRGEAALADHLRRVAETDS